MTRKVEPFNQIVLRLLPFEDYCYLYLEHGPRGALPRGLGRQRSYRLELPMEFLDLDDPEQVMLKIAERIVCRFI